MANNIWIFLTAEGGMGTFLAALMIAVILDYLTGLAKAWHTHTLKSSVAKSGLIRKFALFAVVAGCGALDLIIPVSTGYGLFKLSALCFTVSEVVSVAENAAAVGVPLPEALTKRLAQLIDSEDDDTRVS
ncbi:phage holin family protein [Butyricicoccus sp.]|uniref:phage holin family protein n=1 Tax=Butyricicoccus sp. TaxID=2049021 RepID=UPI003F18961E